MISGGEHGVCDMRHHVEFVVLAGRLFQRDKKADEGNSAATSILGIRRNDSWKLGPPPSQS